MITALRNGKYVTQNASLFRKVNLRSSQWEEEDSDDDESADYDDDDREENQEENHSQNCSKWGFSEKVSSAKS